MSIRSRYPKPDPGSIEIRPGDRLAIHRTGASQWKLVVGPNPVGPRGGQRGNFVDGRVVATSAVGARWMRRLWWKLVYRLAMKGDEIQTVWAAQLVLEEKAKGFASLPWTGDL